MPHLTRSGDPSVSCKSQYGVAPAAVRSVGHRGEDVPRQWHDLRSMASPVLNAPADHSRVSSAHHVPSVDCSLVERWRRREGHSTGGGGSSLGRTDTTVATADGSTSRLEKSQSQTAMRTEFGQRWRHTFEDILLPREGGEGTVDSPRDTSSAPPIVRHEPAESCETVPPASSTAAESRADGTTSTPADHPVSLADVVSSPKSHVTGLWIDRLKDELRDKEAAMLNLRLTHAAEVADLRQAAAQARTEAGKEVTEQLAGSYAVKEGVLQSAVETERQRVADAHAEVRSLTHDLAEARRNLLESETEVARLRRAEEERREAAANVKELQKELAQRKDADAQSGATTASLQADLRQKEVAMADLSHQLQDMGDRLQRSQHDAQETLRKLEAEFNITTSSYQELLSEATKRVDYLEKVQRKYRALKDSHVSVSKERDFLKEQLQRQSQDCEAQCQVLREEVAAVREELATSQKTISELSVTHDTAVETLKRLSDAQKASTQEQSQSLQRQVETSQHTIQLLRTQIESLQQEVSEEQAHGQELAMRMAEKELQLQQSLQHQQKSAASYKVQSEGTIASLKRQLREKDAQLKALAASHNEPLQRLRTQLEDERGRRAQLEHQFNLYKRKAKEAEENALREVRREQLRMSELCGTPSWRMSAVQTRSQASSLVAVSPPSATPKGGRVSERVLASPADLGSTGANTASVRGCSNGNGHSPRRSLNAAAPESTDATGSSPPQLQTTSIGESRASRGRSSLSSRRHSLSPPPADHPPAPLQPNSRRSPPVSQSPHSHTPQAPRVRHSDPVAAALTAAEDVSTSVNVRPAGGQDSISAISHTSPCNSTGLLDVEAAPMFASREMNGALMPPRSSSSDRPPLSPRAVESVLDETVEHEPWQSLSHGDDRSPSHEQRMRNFHSSAAEVFRRITSSREDFMIQCASIVRQSGERMRRESQSINGTAGHSAWRPEREDGRD